MQVRHPTSGQETHLPWLSWHPALQVGETKENFPAGDESRPESPSPPDDVIWPS